MDGGGANGALDLGRGPHLYALAVERCPLSATGHISAVLQECPGADREEVKSAFKKYEEEFFIPPQDAIRSIIRRFKSESDATPAAPKAGGQSNRPTKKVSRLSELKSDDRDIEIEVEIVSHNVREQMIRGESKSIAFGLLEDDPWQEGSGERTRWEYKDWGNNSNITPGSVVRIEGASVNEYQGRMSLNINQSSRIAVLREGSRPVVAPGEPVDIAALPSDGYVCVVGRLMSSRADQIHRRDGSGSIDVVRGRLADESGAIGFLSWEPFEYEIGTLLKIDGAQVKTFRDTPELNFGRTTKIEPFHDASFANTDALKEGMVSTISTLRDGSKDVEIVVNITSWEKRTFTKDGEERYLWSGQIADPTGQCRVSAWTDLPIDDTSLPMTVRITDARVRAWQGIPDITIDREEQLTILDETPWEGELDLENLKIEVPLEELVSGPSRVGIATRGTIVSVREDSGTIMRCPDCRRVLREGQCFDHGAVEGNEDVRLRLVLDDKASTCALLVSKDAALSLLNTDHATMVDEIQANGSMAYVQKIRDMLLGRELDVTGRIINDGQGAMILCDGATFTDTDTGLIATELRAQWGLQ
ncbi:MAG: hypothetical protein ACPICB_05325 [Candidatus Poseidoniaceae archaeon]